MNKQSEKGGEKTCILVRFKVKGNLRYMSHAEMMRVFQRACARAGVKVAHSEGFNPHPRLSLVLPRSVGVESDDELLCLRLKEGGERFDIESLKSQTPEGIEIISAEVSNAKKIPEPVAVRYRVKVKDQLQHTRIKGLIEELSAKDRITVERRINEGPETKIVDVRPFLKSIGEEKGDVFADCLVTQSGTIRVDEILGLLNLGTEDLAGPVKRVKVDWKGLGDN